MDNIASFNKSAFENEKSLEMNEIENKIYQLIDK